jgi:hypothetical protein
MTDGKAEMKNRRTMSIVLQYARALIAILPLCGELVKHLQRPGEKMGRLG